MTSAKQAAFRTSLIYTLLGVVWILLSDHALDWIVQDPDARGIAQTWKGWFYILITAGLLYGLLDHLLTSNQREAERRVQAERQARELEERHRRFIEAVEEYAIYFTDAGGAVTGWNSGAQRLLGWGREQVTGKSDATLYLEADRAAKIPEKLRQAALLEGSAQHEGLLLRQDGSHFRAVLLLTALRKETGEVEGFIQIVRDVTARRESERILNESAARMLRLNTELEERVARRTAELESKNRELETFTYSVSHDLKAPLRGIDGYSRLLLEDHAAQLDEHGQRFLRTICAAAMQMNQLIDDLLAYSRLERRAWHSEQVDLLRMAQKLVAEREDELAANPPANMPRFSIDVPAGAVLQGVDADGLTVALRNLLDNAVKFTRHTPEPRITLRAVPHENGWRLSVQDNGPGFDMKFHERIFEIFQRLYRMEDYPGTGVGLAIVRKAASRMGGRAWAASSPGAGATFYLDLPNQDPA